MPSRTSVCVCVCLCGVQIRRGWVTSLMGHQGEPEAVGGAGHLSSDRFDPKTYQPSLSLHGLKTEGIPQAGSRDILVCSTGDLNF